MLTHVNFNHVNKIEATYKVWTLNVKLSDVLLLRLHATFHALPLFYLRTLILRTHARKTTRHWKSTLRSLVSVKVEPRSTSRLSSAFFYLASNVRNQKRVSENQPFPLSRNFSVRAKRLNFHVYAWPFIHCLYFIYARSHVKITRQWKSTLREKNIATFPEKLFLVKSLK